MGPQKTFFQILTEFGGDIFNRKTGSVRGNDTRRFNNLLNLGKKLLFDFQVFDNHFAYPVAIG